MEKKDYSVINCVSIEDAVGAQTSIDWYGFTG